jgi:hypothetical protein
MIYTDYILPVQTYLAERRRITYEQGMVPLYNDINTFFTETVPAFFQALLPAS